MPTSITGVAIQVLTAASGTYTPTAGMHGVLAILQAGGAGGDTAAATDEAAGGGGEGGRAVEFYSAATIGASQAFTVGQTVATDTVGENSTLGAAGALMSATGGGSGAVTGGTTTLGVSAAGGTGGVGSNGTLNIAGEPGWRGVIFSGTDGQGGTGGGVSGGASGGSNIAGGNAGAYGGGGAGGHASGTPNRAGGTGAAGVIVLLEFLEAEDSVPSLLPPRTRTVVRKALTRAQKQHLLN